MEGDLPEWHCNFPDRGETRGEVLKMATYETSNGNIYEFSFERQLDGSIRAYIVQQPAYGSRESSCHTTHRLTDGERYYVCWNKSLYTMADVKKVAAD